MSRFVLRLRLVVVLTWLVASGTGCFSYATTHTAEPIEPGARQFALGGGFIGALEGREGRDASDRVPIVYYQNRLGLSEVLDFGLRLNGIGLAADLNYAVVLRETFVLSLDPEISFVANQPARGNRPGALGTPHIANHVAGRFNVLADVVKLDHFDLTLNAAPGYVAVTGPNFLGNTGPVLEGGAAAHYRLPGRMIRDAIPFAFMNLEGFLPLDAPSRSAGSWGYSAVAGVGMKL